MCALNVEKGMGLLMNNNDVILILSGLSNKIREALMIRDVEVLLEKIDKK